LKGEGEEMNAKKIIAREGLIILGIVVFSIGLIVVSKPIANNSVRLLPLDDWELSPPDESDAINKIIELRKEYPEYNNLSNMELAKRMAEKHPDWVTVNAVMQRINKESIEKHHEYNYATAKPPRMRREKLAEYISSLGYWILIFVYPLYWLVRFSIWAIKTLRTAKKNDAAVSSDEVLSEVVFLLAIVLLICGTLAVFLGKSVGIVTSVYGVAVLCLIFSRLHSFEWFEGFGIKAQLKKKMAEADQTIERVKKIALPLAEQLLTNSARAGRWGTMVKRRERYRLEENIVTGLRDLGFSNEQIEGARKDCHEMNIFDLAMPIWEEVKTVLRSKENCIREEMSKIPTPIAGENHAKNRALHEQLKELGEEQKLLESFAYQERKGNLSSQYVDFVNGGKFLTADEKNEILQKLNEELEDLKYYLGKKEFRRLNVWFLHDDVQPKR
jgi:uncharacterized membrane protein YiaA